MDLSKFKKHKIGSDITNILRDKTQNESDHFFDLLGIFYFSFMASAMRAVIQTEAGDEIPIANYVVNLATCVSHDTEFLTPNGWKAISAYEKGDEVLEVNIEDKTAYFRKPLEYIDVEATEDAYVIKPSDRSKLSMCVSPNHKIPYEGLSGSGDVYSKTVTASELSEIKSAKLLHNFNLDSSYKGSCTMSDLQIQLQVAFCADGTITPRYASFGCVSVKKYRKKARLEMLLINTGTEYTTTEHKGYTKYRFNPPTFSKDMDWVWNCNTAQLSIVTHESIYWDGCIDKRTGNYRFYTGVKAHADVMQYAYANTFNTVISITEHLRDNVSEFTVYATSTRNKSFSGFTREPMPNGRQYCFTTGTGYWLMRHNGHISVTHNSGYGKNYSTNIMEEEMLAGFNDVFANSTFPVIADVNLQKIAVERALRDDIDEDAARTEVEKEFNSCGLYVPVFDSGTVPALKQMRHLLLMANCGSLNFKMDEIGTYLTTQSDMFGPFLELFDIGRISEKITKNSAENKRITPIDGRTPANMLLFGTDSKLLDGGKAEDEFRILLDSGYGRRCFFGISEKVKTKEPTAQELYDQLMSKNTQQGIASIANYFTNLAQVTNYGLTIQLKKAEMLMWLEYRRHCSIASDTLDSHEEILKAELIHRHFKVLKAAGAMAFVDSSPNIKVSHLEAAILIAEESGKHLRKILQRDKNYVRLAKYLAGRKGKITHADLASELPFYKGTEAFKRDMVNMAASYGHTNGIVIRSTVTDGVELLEGNTLEATDPNKVTLSYSTDIVSGYANEEVKFSDLHLLCGQVGMHWTNHHLAPKSGQHTSAAPTTNPSTTTTVEYQEDVL